MVSPLVLIHPAEEHVQQVNQQFLVERERLFVIIEVSDYLVNDVDDFCGFVGLPIGLRVFLLYEKSDIVHEAGENLLFLSVASQNSEKAAGHVLARFVPITELVFPAVVDGFVGDGFLELLDAVIVCDGLILFCILCF